MLSSIWASLEMLAFVFFEEIHQVRQPILERRKGKRFKFRAFIAAAEQKVDRAMEIARQTESHVQTGKSLTIGIAADDFPCDTKLFGEVSGLHFVVGKQLPEPFDKFLQYTHK